jgi:hypothetical protein
VKVGGDRNPGERGKFDRGQHNGLRECAGNFQPYVHTLQWPLCECHAPETRKIRHGALPGWELSMNFAVVVGSHGRRLHEQFAFLNQQKSAKLVK